MKNTTIRYTSAAAILLLLPGLAFAAPPKVVEEFSGKVIGVTDGDTIKVLVNKETITLRLEGIDAPESGQSFGRKSKEALANLVAGKAVTVRKTGTDKFGHTLAVVALGDLDANVKLIEEEKGMLLWTQRRQPKRGDKHTVVIGVVADYHRHGVSWRLPNILPFSPRLPVSKNPATYHLSTHNGLQ